jgi:glutamate synthase domain-containing protein 3
MSALERLNNADEIDSLRRLIERHAAFTKSRYAQGLLDNWETTVAHFWKVIPHRPSAELARPFLQFESLKVVIAA